jgi:hypothetical protein
MGKSNKICKSGLSRNQIKKPSHSYKKEFAHIPTINKPENKQQQSKNIKKKNTEQIKISPNINYNLDALQKANETLGLTYDQIKLLYSHPLRNRRYVKHLTLTKREKKKELRKMRKQMKENMEEKTKLDITMNPNLHERNKISQNLITSTKEENHKINHNKTNIGFNFDEINGLINDMMDEEENKAKNYKKNNKSSIRIKKQRNAIYNEVNQINNVLNNKEFIDNPNEIVKMQIQENHKQNERNRQIREEFNLKYNFLNLK